jgi:hypothetical protein
MKKYQGPATLLLRFARATGFLSAVVSRLSLWEVIRQDGAAIWLTQNLSIHMRQIP